MKKVIEVSIGGINFSMEDDAYFQLKAYLSRFEETIPDMQERKEVMEDVEARVAEIFRKELKYSNQVVDKSLVQIVINHLGEVEQEQQKQTGKESRRFQQESTGYEKGEKRLYRNPDDKMLSGVCGGLAAYFNVDATIIRILFAVVAFAYGMAVFAYIVLWLVVPKAHSIAQKLQMRGYAPTAENIRKYASQYKNG